MFIYRERGREIVAYMCVFVWRLYAVLTADCFLSSSSSFRDECTTPSGSPYPQCSTSSMRVAHSDFRRHRRHTQWYVCLIFVFCSLCCLGLTRGSPYPLLLFLGTFSSSLPSICHAPNVNRSQRLSETQTAYPMVCLFDLCSMFTLYPAL